MKIIPYLYLPGTCEEAMNFYQRVLGGEQGMVHRFKDAPEGACGNEDLDKIMHGHLKVGNQDLFFSDLTGEHQVIFGNQVSLSLSFTEVSEIDRVFQALSEGGQILIPLGDMFWGAKYGKITDKFGVHWDLNCPL